MRRVILLDLDGPILDGKEKHFACYSDILKAREFKPIDKNWYWDLKRKKTPLDEILALSDAEWIVDFFQQEWMKKIETLPYLNQDILRTEAIQTIRKWRSKGMTVVLITNRRNVKNAAKQVFELQLNTVLDRVLINNPVLMTKAERLKKCLNKSWLSNALFVGDTEDDQNAANQLNVPFLAITTGVREKTQLKAHAYYESISEINLDLYL